MKVFRDSVHGYIKILDDWCRRFIDTPTFQRLRHIEQTSMRCLFPSARHDRFIHSLGTYHLGEMAFASLTRNADDVIDYFGVKDRLDLYKTTFLVACLLHDVAHAPFSHTFEENYDLGGILKLQLLRLFGGEDDFEDDLMNCQAAPHEKASAIMVLQLFAEDIKDIGGDAKLAARMIMGCTYHNCPGNSIKRFENALITLLNGNAVDVDKLDYIARDTWASGVNNASIDIDRLLGALTIAERNAKLVPAFKKQALSVVEGVVEARNFLYRWIYGHHKVQYDQHLLKSAVNQLAAVLAASENSSADEILRRIFSLETFENPQSIGGFLFDKVTDGDLIYLLKSHQDQIPEAREWLSRKHLRRTAWKTREEFDLLFRDDSNNELTLMIKRIENGVLAELCSDWGGFLHREVRIKELRLSRDNLFIFINNKPLPFPEVFEQRPTQRSRHAQFADDRPFFLLYQPNEDSHTPEKIRNFLRESI